MNHPAESEGVDAASIRRASLRLLFTAMAIIAIFVWVLLFVANDNLEREKNRLIQRDLDQAALWYENIVEAETEVLAAAMQSVVARDDFLPPFKSGDREDLQRQSIPLYETLNREFRVTHFYFHGSDREVFFRAHAPARFGDTITRETLLAASSTLAPSAAVEIGIYGLTLRYVVPWYEGTALVGFLELGLEIGHLFQELEKALDIQAMAVLDAADLDRARVGASGLADIASYSFDEDRLLVRYGNKTIGADDRALVNAMLTGPAPGVRNFQEEGRVLSASRYELRGIASRAGDIVFIKDVTAIYQDSLKAQRRYVGLIASVGLLACLAFFAAVSSTQRQVAQLWTSVQQRLADARASAKIGSWQMSADSKRVMLSLEAQLLFGLPDLDELPVKVLLDRVDFAERAELLEILTSAWRDSLEFDLTVAVARSEGDRVWCRIRGRGMTVANEPVLRGTVQDVSDLKGAEIRAIASEERQAAIIQSTSDGIVLTDEMGHILLVNKAVETMFGYPAEELIARNISTLMTDEMAEAHVGYMKRYVTTGIMSRLLNRTREFEAIRRGGEVFPIRVGVVETFIDGERFFVGSLTDLSQINELQSQLRHSQKMDAIGALSGGLAHDFNNILGIVLGQLELLQLKLDDPKKLERIASAKKHSTAVRPCRGTC